MLFKFRKESKLMKKGPRYREKRRLNKPLLVGTEWNYVPPKRETPDPAYTLSKYIRPANYTAAASTYSERCWDEIHKRSHAGDGRLVYKTGGPFYDIKSDNPWFIRQAADSYRSEPSTAVGYRYEGGFVPDSFGPDQLGSIDMEQAGLLSYLNKGDASPYGSEGWDKARPSPESTNLAQQLYELKDLPESMKTTAKGFSDIWNALGGHPVEFGPKAVADHYLNHVFGWKPFLKDLSGLYDTYKDLDNRVAQVRRDNGNWIKRRRTVKREVVRGSVTYQNIPRVWPVLNGFLYRFKGSQFGYTNFYKEEVDDVWFEGCFSYYLPAFDPSLRRFPPGDPSLGGRFDDWVHGMAQKATVLGARYSPALVYKVMPWTWLGDWFHNGSHMVNNLSAQLTDNLVAKYAFIMRHTQLRVVNDTQLWTVRGDKNMFWYQNIETKHRESASPYGFNLAWPEFTPSKLAILAALGISRYT